MSVERSSVVRYYTNYLAPGASVGPPHLDACTAEPRSGQTLGHANEDPFFDDFGELVAASLQRGTRRDHARKAGHGAAEYVSVKDGVSRLMQCFVEEIGDHRCTPDRRTLVA